MCQWKGIAFWRRTWPGRPSVFGQLEPDLPLAPSPVPGVRRTMSAAELRQLLRRHQLPEVSVDPVCFEQAVEPLAKERILESIRKTLQGTDAKIEIVDYSKFPVPHGDLDFRLAGLGAARPGKPEEPRLWRGVLRYGERRSLRVWAHVRIRVARRQVVAVRDLPVGKPIAADDLAEQDVEGPPALETPLRSVLEAAGTVPRRRVRNGEPLFAAMLRAPIEIQVGDVVRVEVLSGNAHLEFEGRAETAGPRGASVFVKNPQTGGRFTATVEGKGKVAVRLAR